MNKSPEKKESAPPKEAHCSRAAFLVDSEDYFRALDSAFRKAKESILIVGWAIDGRITLDPENGGEKLYDLLNQLAERTPGLQVHILIWDFPVAYSLDREPLQSLFFPQKTHRRIHFRLDSELPMASSHHQKIVVVDDKVAFVGGMDVTSARWDTIEHRPEDPRRKLPNGKPYPPYHDVQMVVDRELAESVGEVARKRWLWATGEDLPAVSGLENDPWPDTVEPDLRDVAGSVALTFPRFKGRSEVRDVEALYKREIASARSHIYIENQYLTSSSIQQALIDRLKEEGGPEIVIILTRMTSGLLEQLVMEPLQSDILDSLYKADEHDRLGVYCPFADGKGEVPVKVHSKLMIADDTFFTVGSANLNERSMGLDSECNLAMRPTEQASAIREIRHKLLAHHLGVAPAEYGAEESSGKGILGAVKALGEDNGRLRPEAQTRGDSPLPVDPEVARQLDTSHPGIYDVIMDEYGSDESSRQSYSRFLGFGLLLTAFILLALAWRFTPLSTYASPDAMLRWAAMVGQYPFASGLAVLIFVLGGLVLFPVTLMIALTASIFDPLWAFAISLAGCIASAIVVYAIGNAIGHESVKKVTGSKINTISKQLGKHGLPSMLVVRILPVAPYSIINLVAGASHINFRTYLLGTVLGMVPGIIGMTLFGGQLMHAIRNPGPGSFLVLGLIVLAVVGAGALLRWRLKRLQAAKEVSPDPDEDAR
jgi:phosphatidylserine/phosphatidylglycerophosphate/cardiolipin synthase-like enzyme/uncharacterized membrane protein YdjX (TVP38/TMEM64 family)